jgi:hypothetical protein
MKSTKASSLSFQLDQNTPKLKIKHDFKIFLELVNEKSLNLSTIPISYSY